MSAGAFSDAAVIQASQDLVCIFVDCDWGKKNADLQQRYGIRGYPTVIFCDPQGNPVEKLNSVAPPAVAKQIRKFAGKAAPPEATALATPPGLSIQDAIREGQRSRKPVAIFFYDDSPPSLTVKEALTDDAMKNTLARFILAVEPYQKGSAASERFEVTRAPTLLIVDALLAKPEEKPIARISGSRTARELLRDLETVGRFDPQEAPSVTKSTREAPPVQEEKLSDDDINRTFIQARITVALELAKKGKKDKAIAILEDVVASYPKEAAAQVAKKELENLRR